MPFRPRPWTTPLGLLVAHLLHGTAAAQEVALRHENPTGVTLHAVAANQTGAVAVGGNGVVLFSTDRRTWQRRQPVGDTLRAVAAHSEGFVAVGDNGAIVTSPDGLAWQSQPSPLSRRLNAVAVLAWSPFTPSRFFAAGEQGTILESVDGRVWARRVVTSTQTFRRIVSNDAGISIFGDTGSWAGCYLNGWFARSADVPEDISHVVLDLVHYDSGAISIAARTTRYLAVGRSGQAYSLHEYAQSWGGASVNYRDVMTSVGNTAPLWCLAAPEPTRLEKNSYRTREPYLYSTAPVFAVDNRGVLLWSDDGSTQYGYRSEPFYGVRLMERPYRFDRRLTDARPNVGGASTFIAVGERESIYEVDLQTPPPPPPPPTLPPPPMPRLVNVSARAWVSEPTGPVILGAVLRGAASREILVRAVGPGLAGFGVTNPLPAPRLQLHAAGELRASSGDAGWSGSPAAARIVQAARDAGAFALNSGRDAALLETTGAGLLTSTVEGVAGEAGECLAELYDVDALRRPAAAHQDQTGFINVAVRAHLPRSGHVFVGFTGSDLPAQPPRALVRAIGPGLRAFGVANPVAVPDVTVRAADRVVAMFSGGGGRDANTAQLEAAHAGFSAMSGDAVAVIDLSTGPMTLTVTDRSGSGGTVLVEVYLIP